AVQKITALSCRCFVVPVRSIPTLGRRPEPVRAPHTAGANGRHTADPAVIYFRRRWPRKADRRAAPGVALSRKGAKSDTRGRKLRSTGTKARARVSNGPNSLIELKKQLEARTRELAEARRHLSEALEQQTATSEVLRVISSSPGGLEPVFTAILENALRICEAKFGILIRYVDGAFVTQVMCGAPLALVYALLNKPFKPPPGIPLERVLRTKKLVHTLDAAEEQHKPLSAELAGARTHIVVPMLKDDELIGVISIYRQEVRPFTDKQIE